MSSYLKTIILETLFSRIGGKERFSIKEQKVLERFLLKACDTRLLQGARFKAKSIGQVVMLKRKPFLREITFLKPNARTLTFLFFDIGNVFEANQAVDSQGRLGGDYLICTVGEALQSAIVRFLKRYPFFRSRILFCRYGGDEFSVVLSDATQEQVDDLIKLIKRFLSTKTAYFGKQQKEQRVTLKENKIKTVTFTEVEQNFLHSLKNGILLGIDGVKDKSFLFEQLDNSFCNEASLTVGDFLQKYPEFYPYFEIARKYNLEDLFVKFICEYLYDPLLEDITFGLDEFYPLLAERKFKEVFLFGLKLKELNRLTSYSFADMLIKDLWRTIKGALGGDYKDFYVGRYGGTIILGTSKKISASLYNKLLNIKSVSLTYHTESVTAFVGKVFKEVPKGLSLMQARFFVSSLLEDLTRDWIKNVICEVKDNKEVLSLLNKIFKGDSNIDEELIQGLSLTERIIVTYFMNERRKSRIEVAKTVKEVREILDY